VCQEFDIEVNKDVIPQIAFYFAGGIGNTGAVCGAVIGAVMAIGLKLGRPEKLEDMLPQLGIAEEFRRRFEAEMGTIHCRELTGLDLTNPQGIEQLTNSDVALKVCFPAVSTAYQLVIEILKDTP
jgi:C_GCAxxG_C_C family probable redox protein